MKNKNELYDSTVADLKDNDAFKVDKEAVEKYIKKMGTQNNNNEEPFPEDTKTENEKQNNKIDTKEDDTKKESEKQKEAFKKQFDASQRAIKFLNRKNLKEKGNFSADNAAMDVLKEDSKRTTIRIFNGLFGGCCLNCCKGSKIKTKVQLVSNKMCSPEINIGANNVTIYNQKNSKRKTIKRKTIKRKTIKRKTTINRFYGCCSGLCSNWFKKANINVTIAPVKADIVSPEINLGKIDANMVNLGNN